MRETNTTKSGSAPTKKRKWVLYDAMSFLVNYLTDRPTSGNLQESNRPPDIKGDGDDEVDKIRHPTPLLDTPTLDLSLVASSSTSAFDTCTESVSKHKNASCKNKDKFELIDREILQTLKNIKPSTASMEEDEDLLFFKNLVPKMKCMTDVQKLELQNEITNVFLKHLKKATNPSISRNVDGESGSRSVYYQYTTSTRPDDEYDLKCEPP